MILFSGILHFLYAQTTTKYHPLLVYAGGSGTISYYRIVVIMKTTILLAAIVSSWSFAFPFQPPHNSCQPHHPTIHQHHPSSQRTTSLYAKKPAKRSKSKSSGGFGSSSKGGGFASSSSKKNDTSSSSPADPTKVRVVSGFTGSGTKVLATAANNFDRIRKLFGKDATTDVYVRSPLNDESTFWFVGKVIRMTEEEGEDNGDDNNDGNKLVGSVLPSEIEAVISQKRLILEYAKNQLRPQNMGGPYSKNLELWTAPGDSEMDVVQNKVTLVPIIGSSKDLREGFNVNDVGYNPEIYVGEEKEKGGLRVVRDNEGRPVKPVFEISG